MAKKSTVFLVYVPSFNFFLGWDRQWLSKRKKGFNIGVKIPNTGYNIYTGHKLTAVFDPFDLAASSMHS